MSPPAPPRACVRCRDLLALGLGLLVSWALLAAPVERLEGAEHVLEVAAVDRIRADGVPEATRLPETSETPPGQAGIERRYSFGLDLQAPREGRALYLSGVIGHVRIALNGQPLLDTITEPLGPTPRGINRLRLVDLPPYLLHAGTNRVDITLRSSGSFVSLSRVTVGPQQALHALRDRKAFLMVYGPVVVSAVIGCLGLSVLLIWLRRPHETIHGWYALASLTWGLHTAWGVSPRTFLPPAHYYVWWASMYFLLVVALSIFALRFAGYAWRRIERVLLVAAAVMPLVYYTAQALGVLSTVDIALRLCMVLIAFAALAAVARAAWFQRSVESTLLVVSGIAAAGLGLRDWVVFTFRDDNLPLQLAPYAGLPFVALVAWFLIDRFVRTNESLEGLNRELEARVQAKSRELVTALDHMRDARDRADTANRAKTGFLAAASHDLRQPIHALGLYMGALRQRTTDPVAREIVDRMDHSVGALDSLLDSLLDISRIDAGALVPRPVAFDLGALIRRLGDEFAADAAERGLRLSTRIGGEGSARAWSDPMLVERLLRNLIANAVKYTRRGGVLVTCRARRDVHGPKWRVEVWDTGPGIASEEQERVFEEFYQAGNPERDRRGGMGLGLSIVRRLAQLLMLPLALHSVPGRGTRFVVVLPATEAQTPPVAEPVEPTPLHGLRIAVIEDDAEVRGAMRSLLGGWGCDVIDGADCEEILRRQGTSAPHALVADLRLRGGRDGITEAQRLRAAFGAAVPVLLVSGDTAPERVRLMEASGLPWLAKPVQAARLRAWLAQVRQGEGARAPTEELPS